MQVLIFGGEACENVFCLFVFIPPVGVCIDAYVTIGRSMSCALQLINYTHATEENVRNVQVCPCWYRFPIT